MTYKTPEERAAYARAWRAKNPDKVRAADQKKHEKNPAVATERMRQWRAANPERAAKQTQRAWARLKNDPERLQQRRDYWAEYKKDPANKERIRAYNTQYNRENYDPARSRTNSLKYLYGLTPGQYAEMLAAQNGCCALCGTNNPGRHQHFHVDHNHETNAVRSLLCHGCNTGLGAFGDNIEMLEKAIQYLRKHAGGL